MFDLEKSIEAWLRRFRKHSAFDEGAHQEMEQHIRDHIDDLLTEGYDEKAAFEEATRSFGAVAPVGKEERSVQLRPWSLRSFISRAILKNYYKTSVRSLARNPLSSLVNVLGLSAAIGICVLGYAFNRYVRNIDQFHEHKNEVFLTTFWANRDGELRQYGQAPAPTGGLLRESQIPDMEVCRIQNRHAVVKQEAMVFHQKVRMVDPNFLKFFTFPMKWGSGSLLDEPTSIVISEAMSEKYFGDENPIGKSLLLIFDKDMKRTFHVTGVAQRFPAANSFQFDFLIQFDVLSFSDPSVRLSNWQQRITATFVRVRSDQNKELIEAKLAEQQEVHNLADDQWQIEAFELVPLTELYRRADDIKGDISGRGFSELYYSTISFLIIGLMVLVLAASNYINIAIVSAVKRLKEIGLRKVIGARRSDVLLQFLAENLILMSIATIIGVILGSQLFVPWLENTMSFQMDFTWKDPDLLIFLPSVLFFTTLISGVYPAFYVSKIQVANLFKGAGKIGQQRLLTRFFVGFQLFISCLLISLAVLFTQNSQYQQQRDWGYEEEEVLYVRVPDQSSFEQLRHAMEQNPDVLLSAGGKHHLGQSSEVLEVFHEALPFEVTNFAVTPEYFKTVQVEVLSGRTLELNRESDHRSVVINETMASRLGINDPVGQSIKVDSSNFQIIGLVKDFHANSFYLKVPPTMFTLARDEQLRYLALRTKSSRQKEVYAELMTVWASMHPEIPFLGGYQEDVWGNFDQSMEDGSNFWTALATIVTLIAGLGLYGLLALNVAGRSREFSIRKVLGARMENIAGILTFQYLWTFIITVGLAAPASYYMVKMIFELFYEYHMPLSYQFMFYSGTVLCMVMMLIIGIELKRLLISNPVDGLRAE
ncbi:MAG: ABC transporter permease [Cytophagales bacterium]|nr:ABC transporter permease [Cytophagales bacterium]